jgi:hypothetical protein
VALFEKEIRETAVAAATDEIHLSVVVIEASSLIDIEIDASERHPVTCRIIKNCLAVSREWIRERAIIDRAAVTGSHSCVAPNE